MKEYHLLKIKNDNIIKCHLTFYNKKYLFCS